MTLVITGRYAAGSPRPDASIPIENPMTDKEMTACISKLVIPRGGNVFLSIYPRRKKNSVSGGYFFEDICARALPNRQDSTVSTGRKKIAVSPRPEDSIPIEYPMIDKDAIACAWKLLIAESFDTSRAFR